MGFKVLLFFIFINFCCTTFANDGIPFKNIWRYCQTLSSFPCDIQLFHTSIPSTPYLTDENWGSKFAAIGYNVSLKQLFIIRKFCCTCSTTLKDNCPQCHVWDKYPGYKNIDFCSVIVATDYKVLLTAYRYAVSALAIYPSTNQTENTTIFTSELLPYDFSLFLDSKLIKPIVYDTCHIRTVNYRYDPLSNLCANVFVGSDCPRSDVNSCSPVAFNSEYVNDKIICYYKPLIPNPIAHNFSHTGNGCYKLHESRYISSYNYYLQHLYNHSVEYSLNSVPNVKIEGDHYEVSLLSPNYFDQVFRRSLRKEYKFNPIKLTKNITANCVNTKFRAGLYYKDDNLLFVTNIDCQAYIPYNLTHYICESFYLSGSVICENTLFKPFGEYDKPVLNILRSVITKREINEQDLQSVTHIPPISSSKNNSIDPEIVLSSLLNNTFLILNRTAFELINHFSDKNNCSERNASNFCALQGIVDYSIKQLNKNFNLTMLEIVSRFRESGKTTCSMKEEESECRYRNLLEYTLKSFNTTMVDSVFLFVKLLVGNTTYLDSYGVEHKMVGGWIADGFAALIRPFYDVFISTLKFIIGITVELFGVFAEAIVKGFAEVMDSLAQLISTLLRVILSIIVVLESKFLILEYSVLFIILMKYLNKDLWSSLIVLIIVILIIGIERKSPSLLLYVVHDSFYYAPLINYSIDSFDYNYYIMYRNTSDVVKKFLFQ